MRRIDRREVLAAGLAAIAMPSAAMANAPGSQLLGDRLVVDKHERTMRLYSGDRVVLSFRVALGRQPYGNKVREGDGRTPEGRYLLSSFKPNSAFYRSILISYPNEADRARARDMGVRPGGLIMIHGLDRAIAGKWRQLHWMFNWTNGCIAVTNAEMDLLWDSVAVGTPIEIEP